jgi:serine/threonine-protein kinase
MPIMTNIDLGACETFLYELQRSNLIERGRLDQLVEEFLKTQPRAEPQELADHLVQQGVLTNFQADRVLQGKSQGLVLGTYVLVDAVGQGSMGTVYRAQSRSDGNWYAVKVLPRRSMWNVRLARRQVRSFSQFNHPAVVPFVDVGTAGGLHFLVWPFVQGQPLAELVKQHGKLDHATTVRIGTQLANGLNAAHQQTLFHGLLKPSNIMMGPGEQVQILDFGIGSLLAENEGESLVDTMSTANALTSGLDCTSPESIMEPTNRTLAGDQYSLGCILYWCLAGRYPFPDGSAVEKMMAHQFKQPTPIAELAPDAPPELLAIIERLMQKKPEDRYAGMDEAHVALHVLDQKNPRPALSKSSVPGMGLADPPVNVPLRPSANMPALSPLAPLPASTVMKLRPSSMGKSAQGVRPMPQIKPAAAETPIPIPPSAVPTRKPPSSVIKSTSSSIRKGTKPEITVPAVPLTPQSHSGVRKTGISSNQMKRPVSCPSISLGSPPQAELLRELDMVGMADAQPANSSATGSVREIPGLYPDRSPRSGMGPLGFLALGITVGVACFLAAQTFMK